jgi:glucokinase
MNDPVAIGIDIGGSHITSAIVKLNERTIVGNSVHRKLINAHGTAEEIIKDWSAVIKASIGKLEPDKVRIGIAMPGPFEYEKGISLMQNQDKYDALYNLNIKELLAKELSIKPEQIRTMNDAASFLQGEVFGGAASGFLRVMGLTLGTGLGSAICENGVAYDADLWCSKYRDGIAEDYLSTRWFVKYYKELSGKQVLDVKELAEKAGHDNFVQEVFNEFGRNLALFLLPYLKQHAIEAVVIGGNISRAWHYFLPLLESTLYDNGVEIILKEAELNEHAALIGAASCWHESLASIIAG